MFGTFDSLGLALGKHRICTGRTRGKREKAKNGTEQDPGDEIETNKTAGRTWPGLGLGRLPSLLPRVDIIITGRPPVV